MALFLWFPATTPSKALGVGRKRTFLLQRTLLSSIKILSSFGVSGWESLLEALPPPNITPQSALAPRLLSTG
jgi:hypothetical protein